MKTGTITHISTSSLGGTITPDAPADSQDLVRFSRSDIQMVSFFSKRAEGRRRRALQAGLPALRLACLAAGRLMRRDPMHAAQAVRQQMPGVPATMLDVATWAPGIKDRGLVVLMPGRLLEMDVARANRVAAGRSLKEATGAGTAAALIEVN